MALGSDAEAAAYEQRTLRALMLRAEAAEELVEAQKHLLKARQFECKAYDILVRKAIYEEEIARLKIRSNLFEQRARECERYYNEGRVEAFKHAALSRSNRARTLAKQAKIFENKISIIEKRANDILKNAEEHRKKGGEHELEAQRLEEEAIKIQRQL
ncbi:MAG: hypothetical protein ACE5KV_03660 [Thermoplasmata archaeon]